MGASIPKLPRTSLKGAMVTGLKNAVYTGKAVLQKPVVTLGGKKLAQGTDYQVSYKNNLNTGKAVMTITGVGKYKDSISKTFKINPKGTSVSKVTAGKNAFIVKWKKQSTKMSKARITGYQIQYSTNSKFKSGNKTVTSNGYSKVSQKISGLKGKKKYYVRVRTYMTVGGKKYYSAWSKTKAVRTK